MGTHSGAPRARPSLANRIEATGSDDIPGVGASVVLVLAALGAALGALVGLFIDGAASTAAAGAGVGSLAGLGVVLGWLAVVTARSRWVRRPGRGVRGGTSGGTGAGTAGARRRHRGARRKDRLAPGRPKRIEFGWWVTVVAGSVAGWAPMGRRPGRCRRLGGGIFSSVTPAGTRLGRSGWAGG